MWPGTGPVPWCSSIQSAVRMILFRRIESGVGRRGEVIARAAEHATDLLVVDLDAGAARSGLGRIRCQLGSRSLGAGHSRLCPALRLFPALWSGFRRHRRRWWPVLRRARLGRPTCSACPCLGFSSDIAQRRRGWLRSWASSFAQSPSSPCSPPTWSLAPLLQAGRPM